MNNSGITPMGYKVLVRPVEVEEITEGGIILPQAAKDKEQFAQEEGVFMAAGSCAFTEPFWKEQPAPGVKVIYKKYSGIVVNGNGQKYRLMDDQDIGAVIEG